MNSLGQISFLSAAGAAVGYLAGNSFAMVIGSNMKIVAKATAIATAANVFFSQLFEITRENGNPMRGIVAGVIDTAYIVALYRFKQVEVGGALFLSALSIFHISLYSK